MAYTKKLQFDLLRSLSSASVTGSFQALGTALTYPSSIVRITNDSTQDVTVSIDGTNSHDIVASNSFVLYDATANTPSQGDDAVFFPQGTQFYVKGTAGTGTIYITVLYIVQV